jgi:glycosyltransferase involved in cell wall biosynthesis
LEIGVARVTTDGKHLAIGESPFRVRGVTYGSFSHRLDGHAYPDPELLERDLVAIANAGLNTIRTYTVPPPELLELAAEQGLRVMVGLQYHDWRLEHGSGRSASRRILDAGRAAVETAMELCADNPAVLAVAVGNEIPVDLIRVHGIASVEKTLERLILDVHAADPGMLATYVSFPTTEFLEVGGQDFVSFNVFLEHPDALHRYLNHLQVVAGAKPLLVAELGLAGAIHGLDRQAESIRAQLDAVDLAGCAGATVFSWTDDWAVADEPIDGWGFGITTRDREPKPALSVVEQWARRRTPDALREFWPPVSVIVCAYNEERRIEECLSSLFVSDYPDLEVIVCDDGSTDDTLRIARQFPFKVLELGHGGLSRARNAGLEAATGEIIAYLDADAACHPDWPYYIALSLEDGVAATGGPNLPFPRAGLIERAVAVSPGAPMEVLLTESRAEHVPGCNMAYRRGALEGIGGFDPIYTSAGDDVDVCWKLLDAGEEIGFAPAAQVLHHRRDTIRGYLRQQRGYGRAERLLAGAHRHRFNRLGQARWTGFVYNGARLLPSLLRPVVYHGYQGMAPFQPVAARPAEQAAGVMTAVLPLILPLAGIGLILGVLSSWWLLLPALTVLFIVAHAALTAAGLAVDRGEPQPVRLRMLVGLLHALQPFVRWWGRLVTRHNGNGRPRSTAEWNGDRMTWLHALEQELKSAKCAVRVGGPRQTWDLAARTWLGLLEARITTAVAWRWDPRYRIRYVARWGTTALLGGVVLIGVATHPAGWAATAVVVVALIIEGLALRRRVRASLGRTTEGSRVGQTTPPKGDPSPAE